MVRISNIQLVLVAFISKRVLSTNKFPIA